MHAYQVPSTRFFVVLPMERREGLLQNDNIIYMGNYLTKYYYSIAPQLGPDLISTLTGTSNCMAADIFSLIRGVISSTSF